MILLLVFLWWNISTVSLTDTFAWLDFQYCWMYINMKILGKNIDFSIWLLSLMAKKSYFTQVCCLNWMPVLENDEKHVFLLSCPWRLHAIQIWFFWSGLYSDQSDESFTEYVRVVTKLLYSYHYFQCFKILILYGAILSYNVDSYVNELNQTELKLESNQELVNQNQIRKCVHNWR